MAFYKTNLVRGIGVRQYSDVNPTSRVAATPGDEKEVARTGQTRYCPMHYCQTHYDRSVWARVANPLFKLSKNSGACLRSPFGAGAQRVI